MWAVTAEEKASNQSDLLQDSSLVLVHVGDGLSGSGSTLIVFQRVPKAYVTSSSGFLASDRDRSPFKFAVQKKWCTPAGPGRGFRRRPVGPTGQQEGICCLWIHLFFIFSALAFWLLAQSFLTNCTAALLFLPFLFWRESISLLVVLQLPGP